MTVNILGRGALAVGLAATMAVGLGAQSNRGASDRSNRNSRNDDQSDRNAVTETVNKTIPLPANGRLKLRTFSGYVHITGTSGRDVVIKAVRRADRDVLDHVRLTIDTSGSTVSIEANDKDRNWDRNRDRDRNDGDVVRTDFDIEVPASAALDISGFSSPVEVTGVTGDERLETFSGHITATGAKGSVNAHSFNGAIDIDLSAAGTHPELDAHTFSASIRARLADTARADVVFNSFSGSFDSDLPLTMRSSRRGKVTGRVGRDAGSSSSSASLRFETFSGDVKVVR